MITAKQMLVEMRKGGLTDASIAELADIDQGQTTRIRNGTRVHIRQATYEKINLAYLKWQADAAAGRRAA